jgi:hypothetical protein
VSVSTADDWLEADVDIEAYALAHGQYVDAGSAQREAYWTAD